MSDKYKSSEDLLLPVPAAAQLPEDRTIRDGVVALDCFFDWMQKKDKGILIKIFQEEIEMYRHHCREIGSDGVMHNMYHSLLMQAIRADPALYVAMVKLRDDNNTRLIAFPCPGRYYAEGQNIRRCFYEGDAYSLSTTRALCDEFVFLGETKTVTYQNETSGAQVQEFIDAIYEGKNFAEFIPDDSEAYQAFEIFQDNLADHGVDPIRHESAALGMQVF